MTAHELAHTLLDMPDVLVVIPYNHSDTGCVTPLARCVEEEGWGNPWRESGKGWNKEPCIALWDRE